MVIAVLLIGFFLLLLIGYPLAVALGLSSVLGLMVKGQIPLVVVPQRMFTAMDSFPLLALPLFYLAGLLMSSGGVTRRIISFSNTVVGHITGGLALVNILTSMIFAGISGSSVADTAGVGGVLIPSMVRQNYEPDYSAAVTASSSTLGIVIPPSIPMVIMGSMLGVSIGGLFLGGLIPGILVGLSLMLTAFWIAKKRGYPREDRVPFRQVLIHFKDAFWAILMPVIIVGGIVGGVFTATEAAATAVIYSLVIGFLVYRELRWDTVMDALRETALGTAKILLIIGTASLFAWILTVEGFPTKLGSFLIAVTGNDTTMLLVMVAIFLIIGTFMESISALVLLMPILYPIAQSVGIDPIHFGVVAVTALGVGLCTPPVGVCLFVATDVARVPLMRTSRALVPFLVAIVVILLFMVYFPSIVTFIPRQLGI